MEACEIRALGLFSLGFFSVKEMLSTPAIDKGLALLRHRLERERKGEGQGVGRSPRRSRPQAARHSPSPPPPPPERQPAGDNSDQPLRYFEGLGAMARRQLHDAAGTPGLPVPFVRRLPSVDEHVPHAQSRVMPSPRAPRSFSRSIVPIKKYRLQCLRRLGREVLAVLVANRRSKARVMRYLHSLVLNKSK